MVVCVKMSKWVDGYEVVTSRRLALEDAGGFLGIHPLRGCLYPRALLSGLEP